MRECACDSACAVHGDCCRDMPFFCPEAYQNRTMTVKHLEPSCVSGYRQFKSCSGMKSSTNADYSDSRPKKWQYESFRLEPLPLPQRTLYQLSRPFDFFSIADQSEGIVYINHDIFKNCNVSKSNQYFIPKVVYLKCSRGEFSSKDMTTVSQILPWCKTRSLTDATTPYHRSCKYPRVIACQCGNGQTYIDHVHNACLGFDESVPKLNRLQIWNFLLDIAYIPSGNNQCKLNFDPKRKNSAFDARKEMGMDSLLISISPVIKAKKQAEKENLDRRNGKLSDIQTTNGPNLVNSGSNAARKNELTDLNHNFLVEISKTLERRLLCASLDNYLSQCTILDCAPGAILSHNLDGHFEFGGSTCLMPIKLAVENKDLLKEFAPVCWCMEVLTLLSGYSIWETSMEVINKRATCLIKISMRRKEGETLEVYDNAMNVRFPSTRTKWTLSFESLAGRIRQLFHSAVCPEEKEFLRVCFLFLHQRALDTEGKPCLLNGLLQSLNIGWHLSSKANIFFYVLYVLPFINILTSL